MVFLKFQKSEFDQFIKEKNVDEHAWLITLYVLF